MCVSRESAREVPKLRRILAEAIRREKAKRQGKVKRKAKPRKQTRPKVSRLASKWLSVISSNAKERTPITLSLREMREVARVCASALGQDELRGQK